MEVRKGVVSPGYYKKYAVKWIKRLFLSQFCRISDNVSRAANNAFADRMRPAGHEFETLYYSMQTHNMHFQTCSNAQKYSSCCHHTRVSTILKPGLPNGSTSSARQSELFNKQGAYKFGKMKFPEFSRPSKQLFRDNYNEKTRCNELT